MPVQDRASFAQLFQEPATEEGMFARAAFVLAIGLQLRPPSEDAVEDFSSDEEMIWPALPALPEGELSPDLDRSEFVPRRGKVYLGSDPIPGLVEDIYRLPPPDAQRAAIDFVRALALGPVGPLSVFAKLVLMDIRGLADQSSLGYLAAVASEVSGPTGSFLSIAQAVARVGLFRWISRSSQPAVSRANFVQSLAPQTVANNDAVIVHGTIFQPTGKAIDQWWRPAGGDFHSYLLTGSRPNVYCGSDYFRWSGGWNDYAREEAVDKLDNWIGSHCQNPPDIFAHSHGCNVAMMVSWKQPIRELVLMSCPVHWGLYQPFFLNVQKVVSIRVKFDLVIMADRGAQRFRDPRITEILLPAFRYRGHEASRLSTVWRKESLDQHL